MAGQTWTIAHAPLDDVRVLEYLTQAALKTRFWVGLFRRVDRPDLIAHKYPRVDSERDATIHELMALFRTRERRSPKRTYSLAAIAALIASAVLLSNGGWCVCEDMRRGERTENGGLYENLQECG